MARISFHGLGVSAELLPNTATLRRCFRLKKIDGTNDLYVDIQRLVFTQWTPPEQGLGPHYKRDGGKSGRLGGVLPRKGARPEEKRAVVHCMKPVARGVN